MGVNGMGVNGMGVNGIQLQGPGINGLSFQEDTAAVGAVEGAEYMQQGAFTGAGGTYDAHNLSPADFKINRPEHFQAAITFSDVPCR